MRDRLIKTLGVLSAVATLVAFADAYIFHSKLATALRLPSEMPTALVLAFVFLTLVFAFAQASRVAHHASSATRASIERDRTMEEIEQLRNELNTANERAAKVEALLQESRERSTLAISLRKQVLAVLASRSRNEGELQGALGISFTNPGQQALLREVLGDLVSEGVVRRRSSSFDYELAALSENQS
jgi:hypothetical protein